MPPPGHPEVHQLEHDSAAKAKRILLVDSAGNILASLPISVVSLPLPSNAAQETGGNLAAIAAKDFATQTTLALIKTKTDNLDLAITALRDALRGASSKTLTDIATLLAAGLPSALVGGRLDVNVGAQPARSATTDSMTAKLATDAIQNGLTALTPKFAAFGVASSGTNDILAAVTSKKIRVLAMTAIANAQTDIYFLDDTPTTLYGGSTNKISLAQYGGFILPFNPVGWFETGSGKKLQVNLSAANKLAGGLTYVEV